MISAWSADGRREVVVSGPLRKSRIVSIPINNSPATDARLDTTIKQIQHLACQVWGIKIHQLLSDRRSVQFVEPRFAAIFLAAEKTSYTLHRLGRAFDRDHTTILHAIRRTKAMLADGREPFTSLFKQLESACPPPMDGQAEGQRSASQGRALAQEFEVAK